MTTAMLSYGPQRDEAIDVARAIAILGMFIIHAVLVLGTSVPQSGVSGFVLWLCDGRAAATFVTLAGFGVARLVAKHPPEQAARTLRRRAAVLWTLGVVNLVVWPGDILRVYGVALLSAPVMLRWRARTRLWLAAALCVVFVAAAVLLQWERNWNLATLSYIGVWTVEGFLRNLIFDGFRPIVPWLGFFLIGTVLAGLDLQNAQLQKRLVVFGALITFGTVVVSRVLDQALQSTYPAIDALTREGAVGTTSLPPMPLFMLSAIGTTSLLLGTILLLHQHLPAQPRQMLVATGRRALTWYLLHIAVLVTLYSVGVKNSVPESWAIAAGVLMFGVAAVWSNRHRQRAGVMERLLRRLAD